MTVADSWEWDEWALRREGEGVWRAVHEWARGPQDPSSVDELLRQWEHLGRPSRLLGMLRGAAERGVVPDDPVRRAELLLLVGRYEQWRAADPAGDLALRAYRAAAESGRAGWCEALRRALVGGGAVDLVVALAGDRVAGPAASTPTALSWHEYESSVWTLAGQGDWERLWRLMLQGQLHWALVAVRRFPQGWRPGDRAEAALFDRLRGAMHSEGWVKLRDRLPIGDCMGPPAGVAADAPPRVAAMLAAMPGTDPDRSKVELLQAWVSLRATEIALGDTTRPVPDDTDIALG